VTGFRHRSLPTHIHERTLPDQFDHTEAVATAGGAEGYLSAQRDALLLDVLRERTGAPGLQYATSPVQVTGGFWAEIVAVRFEGAPPELDGELIVRIMPETAIAAREMVVQAEVVSQGFPAPRVRLPTTPRGGRSW
jgi:hypothetical protein